jgi:carbon monoxide dehydrogenase subunit G
MQLEHQFRVPVPVAQAWEVLLDVERIAPCMPGATVESFDGETIVGRVKVKVGPIQVTYAGTARFTDKDEAARRAVIEASAKEARGSGTATATITAQLQDDGGSATDVTVTTDLAITGKPAQFGRGVMEEVGNKLLGRFADCLADTLGSGDAADSSEPAASAAVAAATVETPTPAARPSPAPTPLRRPVENEAIDLLDTAGLPVLKRAAPVIIGLVVVFLFWRLVRRR